MYLWAANRAPIKGACEYYRITTPLKWLDKLGLMRTYEDRGIGGQNDAMAMLSADIDLFYATAGEQTLHQISTLNTMQAKPRPDGQVHYPPTTIWDCDDNQDFVHPFNQSYSINGVRHYPSGDFLEPGETLEYENEKGERKTLWEDGVTTALGQAVTFDIARNLQIMKTRWEVIREARGITVPSQGLASYMRDVMKHPHVYVFPNTVDPADYEHYPLQPVEGDEIRILWQGGQSHYIDWYPLRDAMREVFQRYPQAKLVVWGDKFDWITDVIPEKQLEFHGWTPYDAYKLKRGLLRAHINLCPLANNPFNWGKSAIKFYEASIMHTPEATLAAAVGPYKEINDGETGLLYKSNTEFVQKLGTLIENAELRTRLGVAAKQWVLTNRTPQATIPGLFEFYQDCRARTKGAQIVKPTSTDLRRLKALK
jgi:glycosyltransferase involved in cell wall biosynthesis